MADLRGTVRYRFRHDVDDVHVVVEGEAAWVSGIVENLDLRGVGWTMPIARASLPQNLSGLADDDDQPDEDALLPTLALRQTRPEFPWCVARLGNSTSRQRSGESVSKPCNVPIPSN